MQHPSLLINKLTYQYYFYLIHEFMSLTAEVARLTAIREDLVDAVISGRWYDMNHYLRQLEDDGD